MKEKVIDPSEILIDERGLPREDTTHVNPWIRLLARFFDYSLFFLLLWGVHFPSAEKSWHLIPFEYCLWIPMEALFLKIWGKTPGKAFFRIELKQGRRVRLSYATALKRSFNVWFRGLGMGIPIIIFFCLLVAYQRLRLLRHTSWDREENIVVSHRPIGRWRIVATALISVSSLLFYYSR